MIRRALSRFLLWLTKPLEMFDVDPTWIESEDDK